MLGRRRSNDRKRPQTANQNRRLDFSKILYKLDHYFKSMRVEEKKRRGRRGGHQTSV